MSSSCLSRIIVSFMVAFLSAQFLLGQSFSVLRIEGRIDIKRDGIWKGYSSAKRLGTVSLDDSLRFSKGQYFKIRSITQKDYTITTGKDAFFYGTLQEAFNRLLKEREEKVAVSILDFSHNRDNAYGETAMVSRGEIDDDASARVILSRIQSSKKDILSKSLSIIRVRDKESYYYRITNTSSQPIFVSVIELEDELVIEIEPELLELEVNAGDTIELKDFLLSRKRKTNGYYVIGSFAHFGIGKSLVGRSIQSASMPLDRMSFDFVIAGHREE